MFSQRNRAGSRSLVVLTETGQRAETLCSVIPSLFSLCVCTKQNKNGRITRLAIRRVGVWPSSVLSRGDSPCNQPPPCFRFQMYKMEIISTSLRAPTCLKMESWNPVANPLLVGLPTCPYASWLHFDTSQLDSTTPKTLPTDTKIVTLAKSAAPLQIL